MSRNRALAQRWRFPPRPTRWCLPALVSLGLLVSGCGGSSSTDASSPSGVPAPKSAPGPGHPSVATTPAQSAPPAPVTAECRNLSHSDISLYSNTTKTVACTSPHTAYTFAVPTLPTSVAFDGVQIKNDAVQNAAASRCRSAFVTFIGGDEASRALSRLTVTYFLPDQQDFDLEAHWVRCDVVALQSADSLGELPDKVAGILNTPRALDTYGVCARGEPGAEAALVMCSQDHDYRAISALRLGAVADPYPGEQATLDTGKQRCQDLVATLLGRPDGFTYSWTYPSTDDWATGQRFGYCWNQTAR